MIVHVEGKLVEKEPTYVIIDVNGIGYHINISLNTFSSIESKENCKLLTYMHVKEDAQTLYGFVDSSEKRMFLSLISINGVGPSTGLMIQSSLTAGELQEAILSEDVGTIQSVKGIGGKTAQRIILELKDKIKKEGFAEQGQILPSNHNTLKNEALKALTTLGFNKSVAEKSITSIIKQSSGEIKLEELIRRALKTA